jgi:3-hydroxyisobutyrate dehydrogenase
MATHLVKSGYSVSAYDIFPQALERFAAAGGTPAKSLPDSAAGKKFYICMVASAPQLQSLLFEAEDPLINRNMSTDLVLVMNITN